MVSLEDRWYSTRRRRCLRKQDKPSDDAFKVVRTRRILKVVGGAHFWRKRSHPLRSHRPWKTWLHSLTSWTVTESQTLGSSFECWWAPKTLRQRQEFADVLKQFLKMRDAHLAETQVSDTDTSTSTASRTKSAIRRRRKLRLLCRSQDWMAVLQRATGETRRQRLHLQLRSGWLRNGKRVGARGNLHHLRNGGDFCFLKRIPENRRGGRQDTHSQYTSVQHSLFTSAERIARAWLKNCITSLCAWKESVIWSAHVSPFVALSPAVYHEHIIFLIRSSFYHDTRTRTTTGTTRSTPRTPGRQAAPSRTTLTWELAKWRNPAQNIFHSLWAQRACDCFKDPRNNWSISIIWCTEEFGEQGHQAPITEEVKEFGEIWTHGLPDSKLSETSYFQSHMHFDDSAESVADSDLLYARKLWGNPMHCFHLSRETW